jgi:hypothetical protein
MRHFAAKSFHLGLVSVLIVVFSQAVHAAPQKSTNKSAPLIATRQPLQRRVDFPSYQLDPSTILWPPRCAVQDYGYCLDGSVVPKCTVEYCSKKVALTCWNHVYAIDLQCLCKSMNATTCSSCYPSTINRQLYLAWLSMYCTLSPSWGGLSSNWSDLPGWNILEIGTVGTNPDGSYSSQYNSPFTGQFNGNKDKHGYVTTWGLSSCAKNCGWLSSKWSASIVDGDVAVDLMSRRPFQANYSIGGAPKNQTLYFDLNGFCLGWTWKDLLGNCTTLCTGYVDPDGEGPKCKAACTSSYTWNLDNTGLLIWLARTCGNNVAAFKGLPPSWRDDLWVTNSTYPPLSKVQKWPSCLKDSSDCQLLTIAKGCSSDRCDGVDGNGTCKSVSAVSLQCFCPQIKYERNCTTSCGLSWERAQWLKWINDTCSPVAPGTGLPSNWTSLLRVQRSEMLPWGWHISYQPPKIAQTRYPIAQRHPTSCLPLLQSTSPC